MRRLLPLLFLLLTPAAAQAKTFCVDDPACPVGGEAKASIQAAVGAAKSNAGKDRIQIGPGSYRGSATSAISLGPDNPVDVVGAGRGKTIIEGWRELTYIVVIYNGQSSVSDLSLRLAGDFRNGTAIDSHGPNLVERVDIDAMSARGNDHGMILRGGGTVRDTKIALDPAPLPVNYGIHLTSTSGTAPVTISDVEVSGGYGISSDKGVGPITVQRARITASTYGLFFRAPGQASVEDAAVRMVEHDATTPGGVGLSARTDGGGPLTVSVRDSTFVTDNQQSRGLMVEMFGTTPVDLIARDVAISTKGDYAYDLNIHSLPQPGFAGDAKITLDRSAWKRNSVFNGAQNGAIVRGEGNVDTERSPLNLGTDLRPLAGSVLIDNGTPGPLGTESAIDAFGQPRLVDGDSDGEARRDIGAAEAPAGTSPAPVAPVAQADPDPPGTGPPAEPVPQRVDTPPTSRITKLPTRRRPTVKGTATDNHGIDAVELSVTRIVRGRCRSLTAKGTWQRAGKPRKGRCAAVFALRAKGTSSWSLRLKGLPRRGRIEVASRAFDDLGQLEVTPRARRVKL